LHPRVASEPRLIQRLSPPEENDGCLRAEPSLDRLPAFLHWPPRETTWRRPSAHLRRIRWYRRGISVQRRTLPRTRSCRPVARFWTPWRRARAYPRRIPTTTQWVS